MNDRSKIVKGLITALSMVGLAILTPTNSAKADNQPTVPLDDGARYLRGLESKQPADWNFASENQTEADYQLLFDETDIRFVEQQKPEWSNTGERANYSVLVDIYDFSEEEEVNNEN